MRGTYAGTHLCAAVVARAQIKNEKVDRRVAAMCVTRTRACECVSVSGERLFACDKGDEKCACSE